MSGMMWLTIALLLITIAGLVLRQIQVTSELMRRVEHVDTQINNGIAARTLRIEQKLDRLTERAPP